MKNMDEVILTINQGTLKGKTGIDYDGRNYFGFLGVPYAKPPLGKLRFKAPQPPEDWSGIRDATKDGNACPSIEYIVSTTASEDCLVLNIYTPELPKSEAVLKPVMVWIHGGKYTTGSNNSQLYGPEFLLTEDVVLVTINYRLGVLGFLAFDDLQLGVPGNAGCKDMVMALRWVNSNIQYFGGNPNNVTIFGESAGGAAVHFLLLSPMGRGLYHKAIAQSGSALNPWSLGKSPAKELAEVLNYPYTNEKDFLHYLQELPVEEILDAQDNLRDEFSPDFIRSVGPVVEKVAPNEEAFLSENPIDILLQGDYNNVPLMMGYTSSEGIFFDMLQKKLKKKSHLIEDFERMVPHFLKLENGSDQSKRIADEIKVFYFDKEITSSKREEIPRLLHTDSYFLHGIYESVKRHVASLTEPLYLYRFSLDAKLNFYKKCGQLDIPGASHADDLGYLFKTFLTPSNLHPESVEIKGVRRMVKFWTNFAKTGDPNPVEDVVWKTVLKDEINFLDIGEELVSGINPDHERMRFWSNIFSIALNASKN